MKAARLKDILATVTEKLQHRLEAEVLVAHALQKDRTYLYAHDQTELSDDQIGSIHRLIKRRQLGEPVAYLLGYKEFYGRSFKVSPAVLIPRPETEMLIDQIQSLDLPLSAKVLDVGTGSGCVGLTLALEHPSWVVCVSDVSNEALAVCQQNRRRLNVTNVVMHQGSLLAPWHGQMFDLIVANLPYIAPEDPHLSQGDLRHEPLIALIADAGGTELLRSLIEQAPHYLSPGGWLMLEHGYDQQGLLLDLLAQAHFSEIKGVQDLSGQPRLVMGRWDLD